MYLGIIITQNQGVCRLLSGLLGFKVIDAWCLIKHYPWID